MRVYGPYTRKEDGRAHVILIDESGKKRTVSYPKYLMEQHLGRELDPNLETVDHIDNDFTNNDLNNLRIMTRSDHVKQDNVRVRKIQFICPECGGPGEQEARNIQHNRRRGSAGPFCSRSCASKYGRKIQLGQITDRVVVNDGTIREYYTLKEENPPQ